MTYRTRPSHPGSAARGALLWLSLGAAVFRPAAACPASVPPTKSLVASETAFALAARTSVRQAFLDYLADDAWVLQPAPTPAKAWYAAHPEMPGTLSWYPHVADIASSGDLGFTSGPYVYARGTAQSFGQFLTVWRLDAECRWRVVFDGGIAHARQSPASAADPSSPVATGAPGRPPDDVSAAFQDIAAREGLGAALRTYARNEGFLLLLDGEPPLDLGRAGRLLRGRVVKDQWREAARGTSRDASLGYVVGSLGTFGAYAQIWQYDAQTANLGLRVLLLSHP